MPSSFGPDVPGDASFHFVKIRSLGVEQYVIWCGMYLYVRVEVGQPVSGFVFGEWGRIYCTKCFIWDMWMIFFILKCAKDFFPKVPYEASFSFAECCVLGHLVDVFVV